MTDLPPAPLAFLNMNTYGHPYGQPVIGIAQVSAWYASGTPQPDEPVSSITHTYHFADGVIQTCRTVSYRTLHYLPGHRHLQHARSVDTWDRPFKPDRGAFDTSLHTCQRRYTRSDQIFTIPRHSTGSERREKKGVRKPIERTCKRETSLIEPTLFDSTEPYPSKDSPHMKGPNCAT